MKFSLFKAAGVALVPFVFAAGSAQAQWGSSVYGTAEFDTNDIVFLMAGVQAAPAQQGLRPILGVHGYSVSGDAGNDERSSTWGAQPWFGLSAGFEGGALTGKLGYEFTDDGNNVIGLPLPVSPEDGIALTGQFDYWGTGSPIGLQAVSMYNFGGEAFWGRGRLTARLAEMANRSSWHIGAEAAHNRTDVEGLPLFDDGSVKSTDVGGLLQWDSGAGALVGAKVGRRFLELGDDATYFGVDLTIHF